MKRGTPEHVKTGRLARLLKIDRYAAVGLLECLWHFTARHAKLGDVGQCDDIEIAEACYWTRQPSELVDALVAAGWVDRHDEYRLIIHDWHSHCDDYTKRLVNLSGDKFRSILENSGKVQKRSPQASASASASALPTEKQPLSAKRTAKGAKPEYSESFIAFWAAAPARAKERSGKPEAWKAWAKNECEAANGQIMASLEAWKLSRKWTDDGGKYIEGIHRWLNRKPWEDAPPEPAEKSVSAAEAFAETIKLFPGDDHGQTPSSNPVQAVL